MTLSGNEILHVTTARSGDSSRSIVTASEITQVCSIRVNSQKADADGAKYEISPAS
jgi:hypothetical protein